MSLKWNVFNSTWLCSVGGQWVPVSDNQANILFEQGAVFVS